MILFTRRGCEECQKLKELFPLEAMKAYLNIIELPSVTAPMSLTQADADALAEADFHEVDETPVLIRDDGLKATDFQIIVEILEDLQNRLATGP